MSIIHDTLYNIHRMLIYLSCTDSVTDIFPTLVFVICFGMILYKDNVYMFSTTQSWQQKLLHDILFMIIFVLSIRIWLFTINVIRCALFRWVEFATIVADEHICFSIEQTDFFYLTVCWALCLIPANYAYNIYFNNDLRTQTNLPTALANWNATSVATSSIIWCLCEILINCVPVRFRNLIHTIVAAVGKLHSIVFL